MRDARRRFTERNVLGFEVVDRAKNYDAAHPSSWVSSSRGMSKRRRRCQRAGDAHARTHAHIAAHTHIAHTSSVNTIRLIGRPFSYKQALPRKNVRAIGWGYSNGSRVRRLLRGRQSERGRLANMGLIAWGDLLGCRSRRWLRHRADSIALPDIGGGGGDDDGDAAAAGERRLSIFPRSLRDRNTPVHVSALASPVDGSPVLRDPGFVSFTTNVWSHRDLLEVCSWYLW